VLGAQPDRWIAEFVLDRQFRPAEAVARWAWQMLGSVAGVNLTSHQASMAAMCQQPTLNHMAATARQ